MLKSSSANRNACSQFISCKNIKDIKLITNINLTNKITEVTE